MLGISTDLDMRKKGFINRITAGICTRMKANCLIVGIGRWAGLLKVKCIIAFDPLSLAGVGRHRECGVGVRGYEECIHKNRWLVD